jgi:hypothetical protein
MLKLLERSIATLHGRLLVLAPAHVHHAETGAPFRNVVPDSGSRDQLLREVQRLRGAIYLQDGAIQTHQLTPDGRHHTEEDEQSWHLLFLNSAGRVSACMWYRDLGLTPSIDEMRVSSTPLAGADDWRGKLTRAVEHELARARRLGLALSEAGGWAVAAESRCTNEGLLLALGTFSLAQLLGGALCMTTATVRHASSSILRRLGGSSLEADGEPLPSYYDPKYRCVMELLRFDSRQPNTRYARIVEHLCESMLEVPVLAARSCHALMPESLMPESLMSEAVAAGGLSAA